MSDEHWAYWDKVTIIKKKKPAYSKSKNVLNSAMRNGGQLVTTKKYNGGKNSQSRHIHSKNIDEDMESTKNKTIRRIVQRAIIDGRIKKKLKREQLAKMLNIKVSVLAEYETKNPIPNQTILNKMEKILGIKLQGKDIDIGEPYVRKVLLKKKVLKKKALKMRRK